jgi:N-acetylneuraminic acid mutarotase
MANIVHKKILYTLVFLPLLIGCGSGSAVDSAHSANSSLQTPAVTLTAYKPSSVATAITATTGRAWMNGATTINQNGKYGTKGVPSESNVPGARYGSSGWSDQSGDLLLFGGQLKSPTGVLGRINDLWKYNKQNGTWVWLSGANVINQQGVYGTQGVAAPDNVPGARSNAVSWTDPSGNFWLFSGVGLDSLNRTGNLNDLWKYDPQTNMWTWVSGTNIINQPGSYGTRGVADANNVPGARDFAASTVDSLGNLWLFGGFGTDSAGNNGPLNDLWKYDTQTGNWTWVAGSNLRSQSGVYGDQGVADPSDVPGARYYSTMWVDAANNIWLFGGFGGSSLLLFNDVWKYDTQTNMWMWASGANTVNQSGNYGTKGVADIGNVPGSRYAAVSWLDSVGRVLIFGGQGFAANNQRGMLNDVWRYDPTDNTWVWLAGTNLLNQQGRYGTKKVASENNIPGGRFMPVLWVDELGMPWLFGGNGLDVVKASGQLNDLWTMGLYN